MTYSPLLSIGDTLGKVCPSTQVCYMMTKVWPASDVACTATGAHCLSFSFIEHGATAFEVGLQVDGNHDRRRHAHMPGNGQLKVKLVERGLGEPSEMFGYSCSPGCGGV